MLPYKADPHRKRITNGGKRIFYTGNVVTLTGSLELIKLIINSIVSRRDALFITFDIKKLLLGNDHAEFCIWADQDLKYTTGVH